MTTFLNVTDRATTTLHTTINSSDTTIVLNTGDGALFPSTNFIITIENERILIDSRSTDTLTVNVSGRGYTGSTAASHTAGVAVQLRVTAQSITEMQSAINACEVVANKDTTTTLGTSDTKYPSQKAVKTYVDNIKYQEVTISTVGSNTWICPRGVTSIYFDGVAGGGGGGRHSANDGGAASGGGGGGALLNQAVSVTPFTAYTIVVGAGGTTIGGNGGNTTAFGYTMTGGGGGQDMGSVGAAGDSTAGAGGLYHSSGGSGNAGNGGTGTGGGTGGTGGTYTGSFGGGGGGGASGIGQNGGNGANGAGGGAGGSGGFGSGGVGGSNQGYGGAGGQGLVIIKIPLVQIA